MSDLSQHPTDLLQDALDGRLDADGRAALDAHLALCERCHRELDALRWTKAHVGQAARVLEMPAEVDAQVRRMLDDEDRRVSESARVPRFRAPRRSYWVAGSAAAAVVAVLLWFAGRGPATEPAAAAAHLRAFQRGGLSLEVESADPQVVEAHFRSSAAPAARVYDFGMMGFSLVGGRTHELKGRPSSLAAYRGASGEPLTCEMYVGRVETLPPPAQRRTNEGVEFLVYQEREVTVVFWQEGDIVCVLTGTGNPEAIVALAFAKAIKV